MKGSIGVQRGAELRGADSSKGAELRGAEVQRAQGCRE